jgi:hypothetical protein
MAFTSGNWILLIGLTDFWQKNSGGCGGDSYGFPKTAAWVCTRQKSGSKHAEGIQDDIS